jgi:hypothetical protein
MSDAIEKLAELLQPPNGWVAADRARRKEEYERKIQMLVIGWPSLAAALGQLLEEHDIFVPMTLRRARTIVWQEGIDESK